MIFKEIEASIKSPKCLPNNSPAKRKKKKANILLIILDLQQSQEKYF